jgi:hypothetical protein
VISHLSPGKPTGISASTRPSSPISPRYKPEMPRWVSAAPDRRRLSIPRNGEYVSGNFFRTLGIQPWIGRLMTDDDDREGAAPVAVMSYHILTDKYGSDLSVVGAGRLMTEQLYGVAPWDPRMLTIAALLLCAAALAASWIPAVRAATVEPMVALRTE